MVDSSRYRSGLDVSRLANPKKRGGKIVAQCPACALAGADTSGEHLVVFDDGYGKWGCVAFPGDKEHRRQIANVVGADYSAQIPPNVVQRGKGTHEGPRPIHLPDLRFPSLAELIVLAESRGLPVYAGLEQAGRAGMLRCATMKDAGANVGAWVLVDSAKHCAQARRLDGKAWESIGAKAKTLPGSRASWPIGAADIGSRPYVALCEGGPDTLSAWTLAWWHEKSAEIAPVCICGAGNSIHPEALPFFVGKGVWTFPHRDAAGERAQVKWTATLIAAGAAWVKPFDVSPHKDLNDWLTAAAAAIDSEA